MFDFGRSPLTKAFLSDQRSELLSFNYVELVLVLLSQAELVETDQEKKENT